MYKLTRAGNTIIRLADGAAIPTDPSNADYRAYLAWVDNNTPEPADPAPLVYSAEMQVNERIRTTDATPTEIFRRTLAANTGYTSVLALVGVDAGNGALRLIRASVVAKRLGAGALLVGTPVVIANHQDVAAAAWTITAAVSGSDVVVTVTGAAGRTIDWSLTGGVRSFTPAGA